MAGNGGIAGAASLVLVSGAELLRPDLQMFNAMLEGWRRQQLSRNLAVATIEAGASLVSRFQAHSGEFPSQRAGGHCPHCLKSMVVPWRVRGPAPRPRNAGQQAAPARRQRDEAPHRNPLGPCRRRSTGDTRGPDWSRPVDCCALDVRRRWQLEPVRRNEDAQTVRDGLTSMDDLQPVVATALPSAEATRRVNPESVSLPE